MPVLTSSPTAALSPLPLVSKAVDALGDSLNAQMPAGDQGAALAVVATEAMTKPAIAAPNLAVVFPHMSLPSRVGPPLGSLPGAAGRKQAQPMASYCSGLVTVASRRA